MPLPTPEEVATYRREGVVCLRGVLDAGWIEKLRAAVELNLEQPGPHGRNYTEAGAAGKYFGDYCNFERIPAYREAASKGPLGAVAAALMGSARVQLFHEHVLVKEPGTGEATPWHQDQPYYSVDGEDNVSMWTPLDPVLAEVCPRFLAGSQEGGRMFVPKRFKTGKPLEGETAHYEPFDGVDETKEAARLRYWALEPGDLVAFHFKTLHNAPPNRSGHRRRVISFRFIGDDARYAVRSHAVSPPYPEMGLTAPSGAAMPEGWFPVVWSGARAA
jgi:ectoine hydroxylase-related dioxygenase (phytanoyl-CoA dioxygenase family)